MSSREDRRRLAKERAARALATMSPEEQAALTAVASSDPDNPSLDDVFWRRVKPLDAKLLRWMPKPGAQKSPPASKRAKTAAAE